MAWIHGEVCTDIQQKNLDELKWKHGRTIMRSLADSAIHDDSDLSESLGLRR